MVNICCDELNKLNLELNNNKSFCLRFGKRHCLPSVNINTVKGPISWVKETKYLGINITSGTKFKVSLNERKCQFYGAFNSLYSKLGNMTDYNITVHLMQTVALPILTYALEAINLTKSELISLDFTAKRAILKMFKVSDKANLEMCMDMFGISSIANIYEKRRQQFSRTISTHENCYIRISNEFT